MMDRHECQPNEFKKQILLNSMIAKFFGATSFFGVIYIPDTFCVLYGISCANWWNYPADLGNALHHS